MLLTAQPSCVASTFSFRYDSGMGTAEPQLHDQTLVCSRDKGTSEAVGLLYLPLLEYELLTLGLHTGDIRWVWFASLVVSYTCQPSDLGEAGSTIPSFP